MALYVAHYTSPIRDNQMAGIFEFTSAHRAGSKQNLHDARMHMLTVYGNEAVSWHIDHVELKKNDDARSDNQLQLDFDAARAHRPKKRITRGFK